MLLNGARDLGGEGFAIDRERGAGGHAMLVGGAHDQRSERAHFLVEQADGIVLGIVGAKAVRADHLGEAVGLVRRRRVAAAAHFAEPHAQARLGELPCGFGPGESAADDVDVEGHRGAVIAAASALSSAHARSSSFRGGRTEPSPPTIMRSTSRCRRMPPTLLWADEFNAPSLDTSKWSFDTSRNKLGWYNGELQYYAANRPETCAWRTVTW